MTGSKRGEEGKETPERAVGLDGLCQWLENRRDCFLYPDSCRRLYGVEPPKGILVTGIPGTGNPDGRRGRKKAG
ncbi:MAG: hypothetical protein V8S12_00105 [Lachnospiraceae bacterium]